MGWKPGSFCLLLVVAFGAMLLAQNGRKVSGVVVAASTNRPLPNALVRYLERGGAAQETVTDSKGQFEFSDGRKGTITVSATRFGTARRRWPPNERGELRIALVPPAMMQGTVADIMTGRPVDAIVNILVHDRHNIVSETVAVENGTFRVSDLPPGPALVLARAPGFRTTSCHGRSRGRPTAGLPRSVVPGSVGDRSCGRQHWCWGRGCAGCCRLPSSDTGAGDCWQAWQAGPRSPDQMAPSH